VPPRIVPAMWLFAAVPSPFNSLNTWSPLSSVQTLRPMRPVSLSTSAITSEWNPTPGRPGPAINIVPLRSMIEPRRSAPRAMLRRLLVAFQEPSNSRNSPAAAAADSGGSGDRPHAADASARATITRLPSALTKNLRSRLLGTPFRSQPAATAQEEHRLRGVKELLGKESLARHKAGRPRCCRRLFPGTEG